MSQPNASSPARLVGGLFILILVLGPFCLLYVPSVTYAAGDSTRTVALLGEHLTVFRYGLLAELAIALVEVAMIVALWRLLRGTRDGLLQGALVARGLQVAVMGVSMVAGFTALVAHARGASTETLMLLMETRASVQPVWEGFFGLHLVMLALVVRASGLVPRWMGGGLVLAGAAYLLNSVGPIVLPTIAPYTGEATGIAAFIGEVPLFLWLLVRGAGSTPRAALA